MRFFLLVPFILGFSLACGGSDKEATSAGSASGGASSTTTTGGAGGIGGAGGEAAGTGGSAGAATGGAGGGCDDCLCEPGSEQSCYSGAAETEGVGICAAGVRQCAADGSMWGPCQGEVLPAVEDCTTAGGDDDCNGAADDGCICPPGMEVSCYNGPTGTQGVGVCQAGAAMCAADGKSVGSCEGEVLPSLQSCDLPVLDDDCDGAAGAGCCTSGAWTLAAVDTAGTLNGQDARIFVDAQGTVHIVYLGEGQVRYMSKPRGGSWSMEVGSANQALSGAVAFDGAGQPHAVYSYGISNNRFYTRRTGPNTWVEELGPVNGPDRLAIDTMNVPFVARRNSNDVNAYRRIAMGSWSNDLLDNYAIGGGLALVAGSDGRTHLAYAEAVCSGCSSSRLYHAVATAGVWSVPAELGYMEAGFMAMASDEQGHPWFAYRNVLDDLEIRGGANMAVNDTCLGAICSYAPAGAMATTHRDGALHTVFMANQSVHYVKYDGAFQYEAVPEGQVSHLDVAVDSAGGVHIAYATWGTDQDLWYGYRCP